MEKTGCKIICGAPTTLAVKGLMMMMMMMMRRMMIASSRPTSLGVYKIVWSYYRRAFFIEKRQTIISGTL